MKLIKMFNYNLPVIEFDPVIFTLGPITLRWYGLMYLIGFLFAMWLAKHRMKTSNTNISWNENEIENIMYVSFLGIFLGGRCGYILFYDFSFFIKHPINMFKIWEGGMSFHGGLIGFIIVIIYYAKKTKKNFFQITDFFAPLVPFGLGLGRLGNFINGELWGRVTSLNNPLAMLFPGSMNEDIKFIKSHPEYKVFFNHYGMLPRYPSQLYEALLEGLLLFLVLNIFIQKKRPTCSVSGLFMMCYGICRFLIEYFREPDIQLGFFYNLFTMGQILSIPMIVSGIFIIIWAYFVKSKNF